MHLASIRTSIAAAFVIVGVLATVPALAAPDPDELCVQAFLDFKGFDIGPLDGAAGRKTFEGAAAYKTQQKLEIADLGPDNSVEWCALAKADPAYAALLAYDYNVGPLSKDGVTSSSNPDQVLFGDSLGQYVPAERNIRNPAALGSSRSTMASPQPA